MTHHILLVDDDEMVGEALKEYLEVHGYILHYASSGFAALYLVEELQKENILIVLGISDVRMPGMDGITLSRELYHRYKLPMLLISGYPLEERQMVASDADIQGFFYKPYDLITLVRKLQTLLAADSANEENIMI